MPLHGYSTTRRPPSVFDHILAHSYGLGLALFGILGGLIVLASLLFHLPLVSTTLELPRVPLVGLCLMLIAGGVNVMRGLFDDSDDIRRGFRIERGGLILSATAWLAYAVVVIIGNVLGVLGWLTGLIFAAAMILRGIAGWLEEKRLAEAVQRNKQP